jgi:hypothetical protein
MSDYSTIQDLAQKGGATLAAAVMFFVYGLHKYWWRMGKDCRTEIEDLRAQLNEAKVDRDEWKTMSLDMRGLTRQAVDLAHGAIKKDA